MKKYPPIIVNILAFHTFVADPRELPNPMMLIIVAHALPAPGGAEAFCGITKLNSISRETNLC